MYWERNTHDHLKELLRKINNEGLTDENFSKLTLELEFSHLIYATHLKNEIIIELNAKKYLPLFTDLDEVKKHYTADYQMEEDEFKRLLEIIEDIPSRFSGRCAMGLPGLNFKDDILQDTIADGFIINKDSENFFIEGELLDKLKSHFGEVSYKKSELRQIYDELDNRDLEESLKGSCEEILEIIARSHLLTIYVVELPLDDEAVEGFIKESLITCNDYYIHEEDGSRFPLVFTSRDVIDVNSDGYVYAHIINFKRLADRVFSDDLDGIMIDSGKDKKFLERDVLIENYDFIKENCNDKRLKSGHNVLFQI